MTLRTKSPPVPGTGADAIGTAVTLTTNATTQYATVSTAGSYQSSSDKRIHFGLGKETVVSRIAIRWPSGIIQVLKDVKADQLLRIDEPTASSLP